MGGLVHRHSGKPLARVHAVELAVLVKVGGGQRDPRVRCLPDDLLHRNQSLGVLGLFLKCAVVHTWVPGPKVPDSKISLAGRAKPVQGADVDSLPVDLLVALVP